MTEQEKEAIRNSTDIVELISGYTALRKAGARWKGLCPFHTEKTPSFTVDPESGRWHCFGGCSTGGDVFTFLEKAESLSFIEAAERLAARAGITLTPRGGGGLAEMDAVRQAQQEKDRIYGANALAQRFFRQSFARFSLPREYAEQRGLSHQTIEEFGVGFAPDDWGQLADFLFKHGVRAEDAEKARLIFPSRRGDGYVDQFRGRLTFPIVDVQERVVGFGGRLITPAPNAPKYLNSPETPVFLKSRTLYALNRARKAIQEADRIVVVEGYMDAVACHQAGIPFVVATLGTSLTDDHVRMIGRYTKNVLLSFDADVAGVRAALRAAELFAAAGPEFSLRVLTLPEGEDPGSMLLDRKDAAGFHRAIDAARTVPEFRIDVLKGEHDLSTDRGRADFMREAAIMIADVRVAVEQDRLIRRLASYALGDTSLHAEESVRAIVRQAGGGRLAADVLDTGGSGGGGQYRGGGYGGGNRRGYGQGQG
ncbi:MAG TPA: DNA primase, partial [Armatimonadaceae bacterium]|nr:DNA primase [Armatimonadaceae bacterium]